MYKACRQCGDIPGSLLESAHPAHCQLALLPRLAAGQSLQRQAQRPHLTTTISTFDFSTRSVKLNSVPPYRSLFPDNNSRWQAACPQCSAITKWWLTENCTVAWTNPHKTTHGQRARQLQWLHKTLHCTA